MMDDTKLREYKEQLDKDLTRTFDEKVFVKTRPEFSFAVNGQEITIRITTVPGADRYEVWQCETAKGEYELVSEGMSQIQDFYTTSEKSLYYRVRALRGTGENQIVTQYSKPQYVDLVSAAKARNDQMDQFFEILKGMNGTLSYEDLDIAIETLKVAGLEIREKERRR